MIKTGRFTTWFTERSYILHTLICVTNARNWQCRQTDSQKTLILFKLKTKPKHIQKSIHRLLYTFKQKIISIRFSARVILKTEIVVTTVKYYNELIYHSAFHNAKYDNRHTPHSRKERRLGHVCSNHISSP